MSSIPSLSFSLLGDISRNSRALRQIKVLSTIFDVKAIGFSKSPRTLTIDGADLTLLPMPTGSGIRFFLNAHRQLSGELAKSTTSVFHASDLYCLTASRNAAKRSNSALTYDARELYSEVYSLKGNTLKTTAWRAVEGRSIRSADQVFTVSESISDYLSVLYDVTPPTVIFNAPDLSAQRPSNTVLRDLIKNRSTPIILHNGQIRPGRGCENLTRAMEYVDNAVLVFLGDGPLKESLKSIAAEGGCAGRVHFVDPVPPDEVISVTAQATIGVTLLEDSCLNHRFALPNKLFEYTSAGVPVVGSNLPEVSKMIADHKIGTSVDPQDVQKLAETISSAIQNAEQLKQWKNNTSHFSETFGWQSVSQDFLKPFQAIASSL